MPEYSSTTITPADSVKTPAMNESVSGNYTLAALRAFILASKGLANGLASLDANGKLPTSQLPDLADDVLVYGSYALLPNPGIAGKLYITADDNKMYRWDDALATPDYVVLSVDLSAYATKAEMEAADTDLKNALDSVDHRVQNLESAKGDYVPVDSDKGVITTPSGKGKWAVVEKLRGVSRAENRLVDNPTFDGKGDWTDFLYASTVTVSNNVLTAVENNSNDRVGFGRYLKTTANHSYLCLIRIDSATSGLTLEGGIRNFLKTVSVGFNALVITTNANSTEVGVASTVGISGATVSCSLFNVKDLNVYFNTTDLSFLGSTDAQKLATIQTYYPWLLSPSDYGNSLVDTRYEGVRSTSPYNIWNEEWELGRYDNSTGEKISASTSIRSKDFTYVEPNDRLYVICPSIGMRMFFYGINKNFVSTQILYNTSDFTVASGVYYFTFQIGNDGNPITIYGNDIQFCPYSYTEERDTYHHHLLATLSLPTPITLRSAGTVAEEFDLETGEKTNPLGSVDLGTLTWYYDSTHTRFFADIADAKPTISENPANYLCAKYVNVSPNVFDLDVPNMAMRGGVGSGMVWIRDTSYNDATTFKNAMNGVILYYEKATPNDPTQLAPIQNPTILTEAGGTISAQTEEPIDGNFSVGFITL